MPTDTKCLLHHCHWEPHSGAEVWQRAPAGHSLAPGYSNTVISLELWADFCLRREGNKQIMFTAGIGENITGNGITQEKNLSRKETRCQAPVFPALSDC